MPSIIDWEWGSCADGFYPECPEEDKYRNWRLKLLESDFANDIADYLRPLLEMVLEQEKDYNKEKDYSWETGKKAIEAFLAKTSKK